MNVPNMLQHLYRSLASPSINLTLIVCYAIGIILMINGFHRLYVKANNPQRLIGSGSSMLRIAGGAVIAGFPAWLGAGGRTVFGSNDGGGEILSWLDPDMRDHETVMLVWHFISWAASLFGAWAFVWSWITLARASDPSGPYVPWEKGVLQMVFGLILYWNGLWLDALARTVGLI